MLIANEHQLRPLSRPINVAEVLRDVRNSISESTIAARMHFRDGQAVTKTILDETFSLGGNLGGDEIGAKTQYFGGDTQVAQTQSREFARRLLLARRTNANPPTITTRDPRAEKVSGSLPHNAAVTSARI